MARIAITEEVEAVRDEQGVDDETEDEEKQKEPSQDGTIEDDHILEKSPAPARRILKYVATMQQVQEAFDSVNTLRYSQPTHLAGTCAFHYYWCIIILTTQILQGNAKG